MSSIDLVPTRLRLTDTKAKAVAKHLSDQLIGSWGLANASKIVNDLNKLIKTEKKRRKEIER